MTLEKLLNILCEKGWKPFGWEARGVKKGVYNNLYYGFETHPELYHIRMLTSIESGLWQFVCENGMIKEGFEKSWVKNNWKGEYTNSYTTNFNDSGKDDYEYRLIESALRDESELEEFLLNSIIIDD